MRPLCGSRRTWLYLLGGASIAVAAATAAKLALSGSPQIEGSNPQDRVKSICRLADEGSSGAGDRLAEAATGEADWRARQAAVIGLGRHIHARHRPVLERCTRDASPEVRAAAARTLGAYDDQAAVDRLGELAWSDPDPQARMGAVAGLARCQDIRAAAWLHRVAERGGPAEVQSLALKELFKKLDMRFVGAGPSKRAQWLDMVEYAKEFDLVQRAYDKAGWVLERFPENLHSHPETSSARRPGG